MEWKNIFIFPQKASFFVVAVYLNKKDWEKSDVFEIAKCDHVEFIFVSCLRPGTNEEVLKELTHFGLVVPYGEINLP